MTWTVEIEFKTRKEAEKFAKEYAEKNADIIIKDGVIKASKKNSHVEAFLKDKKARKEFKKHLRNMI